MSPEEASGSGSEKKPPKIPDSVLRAALLRRAIEDLNRLVQLRSAKQACSSLLQKGSVGDDLWKRFQRAEKEMEEELRDVVTEVRISAATRLCPVSPRRCRVPPAQADLSRFRPMPWHLTGARPSSSPPTRCSSTSRFAAT